MDFTNKVLLAILLILIGLLVYSIVMLKDEQQQCISDPLRYAVKALESASGTEVQCSCSNGEATVFFNKDGVININP